MAIGEVEGVGAASQHSFCGFCAAAVGFGLWRSKPRRRWAIAGHRSMATGVGEKVEAAEGLYLSCGPRYSRRKMGSG